METNTCQVLTTCGDIVQTQPYERWEGGGSKIEVSQGREGNQRCSTTSELEQGGAVQRSKQLQRNSIFPSTKRGARSFKQIAS